MPIEKTLGELVDELSIVNIKIALLIEKKRRLKATQMVKVAKISKAIDDLNLQRSKIKNAINERDPSAIREVKT